MSETAPRWLDRAAAAAYLCVPEHHLARLQKASKIPAPSLRLGPRSPRWDRLALDAAIDAPAASVRSQTVEEAIHAVTQRGRPHSPQKAR